MDVIEEMEKVKQCFTSKGDETQGYIMFTWDKQSDEVLKIEGEGPEFGIFFGGNWDEKKTLYLDDFLKKTPSPLLMINNAFGGDYKQPPQFDFVSTPKKNE